MKKACLSLIARCQKKKGEPLGFFRLAGWLLLLLVFTSCQTPLTLPLTLPRLGPRYHPTNIYIKSPTLDPFLRRVAVLPISPVTPTEALQAGVESYQSILQAELEKTKRFELIIVSPQELARITGQSLWSAADKLPPDFFDKLREETGCDAVFFAQLTRYQPYQPLAVGWKLTLIASVSRIAWWSADEVFDAGNGPVADSARDYAAENVRYEGALADPDAILSSPSRFGQYSLHALLVTLPIR
jgi:hypothetical protein